MQLIDPAETARRTRAALGYTDLTQAKVAEVSGVTIATLRRIVAATNPRGATVEELWSIADACGVPREFMQGGWANATAINNIHDVDPVVTLEELGEMKQMFVQVKEALVSSRDPDEAAGVLAQRLLGGARAAEQARAGAQGDADEPDRPRGARVGDAG